VHTVVNFLARNPVLHDEDAVGQVLARHGQKERKKLRSLRAHIRLLVIFQLPVQDKNAAKQVQSKTEGANRDEHTDKLYPATLLNSSCPLVAKAVQVEYE
jgi:hypothetical protein